MEPVLATLTTVWAVQSILGGILGNRSNDALGFVGKFVWDSLQQEKDGKPVNDELPRAVHKAHLQATAYVCQKLEAPPGFWQVAVAVLTDTREEKWLKKVRAAIEEELKQLADNNYVLPANDVSQTPQLLLLSPDEAPSQVKEMQANLQAALLKQIRERFGEPPASFIKMIEADSKEDGTTWFDSFRAFFAHELKHNQELQAIFTSKTLSQLTVNGQPLTASHIQALLAEQGKTISLRLAAFDQQLSELTTYQREQFKEVLRVLDFWLPRITAQQSSLLQALWEIQQQLRNEMAAQREASEAQLALLRELTTLLHKRLLPMLTGELFRLSPDYGTRVRNFIHEYLGSAKRPTPFGGRQAELDQLDKWLNDPSAPPYMLLAAEAGRGKSALLVRWTQSVLARDLANVVFVPISTRFNTALASVTFTALAAQLGEMYEETVNRASLSAEQWRGVCQSYWSRTPPTDKPLVIVLDGLDEAADWEAGPDLFPFQPAERVRIVVSARYQVDHVNEEGWRQQLGWVHAHHHLAEALPLLPLTADGVRNVLQQMGNPLDKLVTKVDVMEQLYRLTEGDPLLVRLYVDALLPQGERLAMLQPKELEATPKGLKGYFKQWWKDQQRLWGQQRPLRRENVRIVLNLLACALGPLSKDVLLELTPADADLDSWMLDEALAPLSRFIVGDGDQQGYTFSHPRLGYYFWEELKTREQQKWERRFLDYGRQTLDMFNDGTLHPHNAPSYPIQYYAAHLERAKARPEAFYALVSEGWMRGWNALEGTHAGFLNDVERAWQRAESERDIGMQIKCALCRSSVAALSAYIPPDLLAQAVEHDVLTPVQGLVIVQQTPKEKQRVKALAKLAPLLPNTLMPQALEMALAIESEQFRADALAELAPHLPKELLPSALEIAQAIQNQQWRVRGLAGLAPQFPKELLPSALEIAQAIQHKWFRDQALAGLAPHLPKELLPSALEMVQAIQYEVHRAQALTGLAPHLPKELLASALETAQAIQDKLYRVQVLAGLTLHLPKELLKSALEITQAIENGGHRVQALAGLAPHLPKELLPSALEMAQAIEHEAFRAEALAGLAPHLPKEWFANVLEMAQAIQDKWFRADALVKLAPHLPKELLANVLETAQAIENEWYRARALAKVTPHLPKELLPSALEIAQAIQGKRHRVHALAGLAPHLPKELLASALETAQAIQDQSDRADALAKLTPHLPKELLPSALEIAQAIQDQSHRIPALVGLAPHLPKELLPSALEIAQAIQHKWFRAEALAGLAPHLPKELLQNALEIAQAIRYDTNHVRGLAGLAPHLPKKLLPSALEMARAIEFEWLRAHALTELAFDLPPELRQSALEIAQAIQDERHRADALARLAFHLPLELRQSALEMAQTIQNERHRADALARIAPYLPLELRPSTLEMAQAIQDERYRADALARLAPYLPPESRPSALEIAQAIQDEAHRADALARLAPYLSGEIAQLTLDGNVLARLAPFSPRELLRHAVEIAQAIQDESYHADALARLALHLPKELLPSAIEIAQAIEDESHRADALAELAPPEPKQLLPSGLQLARAIKHKVSRANASAGLTPHLSAWGQAIPPDIAYAAWQDYLRNRSANPRPEFLDDLHAIMPFTLALAGNEVEAVAEGIFHVIQEVCEWWP